MAKQKILIAGGTGLVGKRLTTLLSDTYHIHILSRSKHDNTANVSYFQWDLDKMTIDDEAVNVDHIINLNGAGIADSRWTSHRREVLVQSRVRSNELLLISLQRQAHKVKSFTGASAIGYYGDRGTEVLTEATGAGEGFMSECCIQWEQSALALQSMSGSLSIIRIGIVLSTKDGALPKILMTRYAGILSYFGNGSQYYSWIHIDDLCGIFKATIEQPSQYHGIINGVAPTPLTNKDFTHQVKEALSTPALVVPAPAFALRLAMGEMADVVLNSNRVVSNVLQNNQFDYQFPDLTRAVKDLLAQDI